MKVPATVSSRSSKMAYLVAVVVLAIILSVAVFVVALFVPFWIVEHRFPNAPLEVHFEMASKLGDSFGLASSFVSLFALLAVIIAIAIQKKELEETYEVDPKN